MGLLGNNETKQQEKLNALMKKYHLEDVSTEIAPQIKEINAELIGTGLMETGLKLSIAKAEEQVKVSYLNAIMKQNFIIIRLLDKIANK